MDGDQTKDTLDALADLFLTGTIPGGSPPVRVPPPKLQETERQDKSQEEIEANASELDSDEVEKESITDQLNGPDSIPLHRRPTSRSSMSDRTGDRTSQQSHLEPAVALRLHRDDDPDEDDENHGDESEQREMPAARVEARVEALFVGNLPGWSGPWLVQYAHHLATQRGPVAVLHVDHDQIEIELVTADRSDLNAIDQTVGREEIDAKNLFSLLDVMTFNLDAPVATWLVHLPAPSEPQQKARAAQLYRWSVLTGADDTAIAAGHRLLTQLLKSSPDVRDVSDVSDAGDSNAGQPSLTHRVGAMVMGSDEARSLEAVANFNSASAHLLHQPIELIGHRAAMMPVHVKQYGPFVGNTLWPRVAEYLEELDPSQSEVIETSDVIASPQEHQPGEQDDQVEQGHEAMDHEAMDHEAMDTSELAKVSAAELEALGVTGEFVDDEDIEFEDTLDADVDESNLAAEESSSLIAEPASHFETEPASDDDAKPEREPVVFDQAEAVATTTREPSKPSTLQMTPAHTAHEAQATSDAAVDRSATAEPNLAAMLADSIGGGVALEAKCPRQPDKQIMVDPQGQLHLLRQTIDADVRGSIVDLVETRDWVREHIELLALTQRQSKFDVNAEPMLHLFADDAKAAVAMVSKLGPSVKLHLVQRVNVGSQSAWVCTDLN